jgi:hypothetical protein
MESDLAKEIRELHETMRQMFDKITTLEERTSRIEAHARSSPSPSSYPRDRHAPPDSERSHPRGTRPLDDYERPDPIGFDRVPLRPAHPIDDHLRERPNHYGLGRGRDPAVRPYHDDLDDRAMRSVKVEAPSFVGRLDPCEYLDWEADMNNYFDWYEMSEERKVRFAKMRLLGQAKYYWQNVERLTLHRGQETIRTWDELKDKLREKYLPPSYQQRLLD